MLRGAVSTFCLMTYDGADEEAEEALVVWEQESITGVIGRVLVVAASVEHELDSAIATYLGADEQRWDFVRHDLLGTMTLGAKADLLRRILGHTGLAPNYTALKSRFDEYVRVRNAAAHWHVHPNTEFDLSDPGGYRLAFTTLTKRSGKNRDEVRLYPCRFEWLVNVLIDDLYAIQHRLDEHWERLLQDYQPMWAPDSDHDPTDLGPPTG